jgi:hypothetical protein
MIKKQSQGGELEELQEAEWRGELDQFEESTLPLSVQDDDLIRWEKRIHSLDEYTVRIKHHLESCPPHLLSLHDSLSLFFSEKYALFTDLNEAIKKGKDGFYDVDSRQIYQDLSQLDLAFKGLDQYLFQVSSISPTVYKTALRLVEWIWAPLGSYGYAVPALDHVQWGLVPERSYRFLEIAHHIKGIQWVPFKETDFDLITQWPLLSRPLMRSLLNLHPHWVSELNQTLGNPLQQ